MSDVPSGHTAVATTTAVRAVRDVTGLVRVWWVGESAHAAEVDVQGVAADGEFFRLPDGGGAVFAPAARAITARVGGRGQRRRVLTVPIGVDDGGPQVMVVGSCVSRDLVPFLTPAMSVAAYTARQSLLSAFSAPLPHPSEVQQLASAFQRRTVAEDYGSAGPDKLRDAAPSIDLLLWDLVDERLGVFVHPGGEITTSSIEWRSLHPDGAPPAGARHVPFGSEEHRVLFRAGLERWRLLLEETEVLARTLLVAPRWAIETTAGRPTPLSFGASTTQANSMMRQYVQLAEDVVGVPVIGRGLDTRAGDDHRWGPAPFHFDDETERSLAAEVGDAWTARPVLGGVTRSSDGEVVVSVAPTTSDSVVISAIRPAGTSVKFHLYERGQRVDSTVLAPRRTHTFSGLPAGRYSVVVDVRSSAGDRQVVRSAAVTLR